MLSLQTPKHKQCPQCLSGREGRLGLARAIHCANSKACRGWAKAGRSCLRGGGGGFLKHTAQCKERQSMCPTGQQTGREREGSVLGEHCFPAQTQERSLWAQGQGRRWPTGYIERADWPRPGQTNLLKRRAVTGRSLCDSGQCTPPVWT